MFGASYKITRPTRLCASVINAMGLLVHDTAVVNRPDCVWLSTAVALFVHQTIIADWPVCGPLLLLSCRGKTKA